MFKVFAPLALISAIGAAPALAATVTIDFAGAPFGYNVGAVTGTTDCPYGTAPCALPTSLDPVEVTSPFGEFDILSATFRFLGQNSNLRFSAYDAADSLLGQVVITLVGGIVGDAWLGGGAGAILQDTDYTLVFGSSFGGIARLVADKSGKGANVRLDDLEVTSFAAVPLPAGGLMLAGALGGLAAVRRRRKGAA